MIVRATDFAGNSAEAISDGFTVDFSPPSTSMVWDGTGAEDLQFYTNESVLAFRLEVYRSILIYSLSGL